MTTIQSTFLNYIGAYNLTELEEELTFQQTYHPTATDAIAACQLAIQVGQIKLSSAVTSHFTSRLTSGLEFTGVVNGKYTFSESPV